MSTTRTGRHPVQLGHLVMGIVFLASCLAWGTYQTGVVADDDLRWLLPVPWLLAGGVGLAVAAWTRRPGNSAPTTHHDEQENL